MKSFGRGIIAAAAMVLMGASVNASTINVYNDDEVDTSYDGSVLRATVDCTGCEVLAFGDHNNTLDLLSDDYYFSDATDNHGELFGGPATSPPPGNSLQEESDWLNSITGASTTVGDLSKDETTVDDTEYTITGDYAILKVGKQPNYTILKNTSGTNSFSFIWNGGSNAGLSHTTTVSAVPITVSAVPIPATGLLLIGGLGGLVALRRRRKTA